MALKTNRILPLLIIGAASYFLIKSIGSAFNNVPTNLKAGRVRIKRPSLSFPNLSIPTDVEIVNFNNIPLTVDALYADLYYKGRLIGNANFIQKVNINALKSAILPVTIQVSLLSVGQEFADAISQGGNVLEVLKRLQGSLEMKGSVFSNGFQFPINTPISF